VPEALPISRAEPLTLICNPTLSLDLMAAAPEEARVPQCRGFRMPSFTPEPLRLLCLRYIARELDNVETLDGIDEQSCVLIAMLAIQELRLTATAVRKLRATGHEAVTKLLRPYELDMFVQEPATDAPCRWGVAGKKE
jgi:hypothetical protein